MHYDDVFSKMLDAIRKTERRYSVFVLKKSPQKVRNNGLVLLKQRKSLTWTTNPIASHLTRFLAYLCDSLLYSGKEHQSCPINRFRFSPPSGSRLQIPLRLAWARTVHRAQSTTLVGRVHVVLSKMTHPGQLTVALSRVRNAQDLGASGAFQPPPQRGEVTAFHYMVVDSGYHEVIYQSFTCVTKQNFMSLALP